MGSEQTRLIEFVLFIRCAVLSSVPQFYLFSFWNWFRLRWKTKNHFVYILSNHLQALYHSAQRESTVAEISCAHDSNIIIYFVANVRFWWFHFCCLLCNHEIISRPNEWPPAELKQTPYSNEMENRSRFVSLYLRENKFHL